MTAKESGGPSPFVEGARVILNDGWGRVSEERIHKVYRNGNFVLEGNRVQQWRPRGDLAWKTGVDGFNRWTVRPWSTEADEKIAAYGRVQRFAVLRARLERAQPSAFTDAMLDAIDKNLPAKEKP